MIPRTISGLYAWYRSDNLLLNGTTVSAAFDKSGNRRHAVQSTVASQPNYYSSGGSNNLPYWQGLSSTSAGKYLQAGATGDFDFLHNGTDWTIAYVITAPTNTGRLIFGTQAASSTDLGFQVWEAASPGVTFYMGNSSAAILAKTQASGFASGSWHKTVLVYDNASTPNLSGSIDDGTTRFTANKIGSNSATTSGRKLGIGSAGTGFFATDAKFHELIFYNRKLTAVEIQRLEYYFRTLYNL